jgi:hypothetical protein
MELRRSGQLDKHLQEKSLEAHALLAQLLDKEPKDRDGFPKDIQSERLAQERVMARMLDFSAPEKTQAE